MIPPCIVEILQPHPTLFHRALRAQDTSEIPIFAGRSQQSITRLCAGELPPMTPADPASGKKRLSQVSEHCILLITPQTTPPQILGAGSWAGASPGGLARPLLPLIAARGAPAPCADGRVPLSLSLFIAPDSNSRLV